MAKAINDGTCQICGSRQRLPNGRLAKHGYTTRWGFFSGTCTGSDELPYEQSCGLIVEAIKRAKEEADALRFRALDQQAMGGCTAVGLTMYSVYLPATYTDRQSRREWREVAVQAEADGRFFVEFETRKMSGEKVTKREQLFGTLASIIRSGREGYAEHLNNEAKKYEEYARWQEHRIADWHEAPLMERLGGR